MRKLAVSTIEGHLALLIKSGELDIHELMNEERLQIILGALGQTEGASMTMAKQKLGDEYSFGEIRAAINHQARLKAEKSQ